MMERIELSCELYNKKQKYIVDLTCREGDDKSIFLRMVDVSVAYYLRGVTFREETKTLLNKTRSITIERILKETENLKTFPNPLEFHDGDFHAYVQLV